MKLDKLQFQSILKVWLQHIFLAVECFCYVWFYHVEVNVFTPKTFIVSKAFVLINASSHVFCFSSCSDSRWNCKVSDRKHVRQYNYVTSSDTRQEITSAERQQTEENESWMNDDRMKTDTSIIKGKGDSFVVREWSQSHAMMTEWVSVCVCTLNKVERSCRSSRSAIFDNRTRFFYFLREILSKHN